MKLKQNILCVIGLMLILCTASHAQKFIRGMVVDSTTLNPLPFATVKVKSSNTGAVSDDFGYFAIKANLFDTLIISSVGYITSEFAIKKFDEHIVIKLPETAAMLKPVTVYDRIVLRGVTRLPKQSRWVNPTNRQEYGSIQTFGPGYTVKGALSYFSKSEKEKRRLKVTTVDNTKARTYIELVNSPEVKDSLMTKYTLTEPEYYDILAKFNKANPKSMGLDLKSVTYAIFHFFEAEKRKNALEK